MLNNILVFPRRLYDITSNINSIQSLILNYWNLPNRKYKFKKWIKICLIQFFNKIKTSITSNCTFRKNDNCFEISVCNLFFFMANISMHNKVKKGVMLSVIKNKWFEMILKLNKAYRFSIYHQLFVMCWFKAFLFGLIKFFHA